MARPASAHLTPVASGAVEWGFEPFNEAEHLCVTVPDHAFTITCKDSRGRTTTFHFGNYEGDPVKADNAAPTFLDIQHKGKRTQPAAGTGHQGDAPAFEVFGFRPGGDAFDTRQMAATPSLICIALDGEEHARKVSDNLPAPRVLKRRLEAVVAALEECVDALTPANNDEEQDAINKALAALELVRK